MAFLKSRDEVGIEHSQPAMVTLARIVKALGVEAKDLFA